MTRDEAKKWLKTFMGSRYTAPMMSDEQAHELLSDDADALIELLRDEVRSALKTERADAHWRSWDFGG